MEKSEMRDEANGRRAYVIYLLAIFIFLPTAANIVANAFGFSLDIFTYIRVVDSNFNLQKEGYYMDILAVWYIQIPLFAYFTYKRTIDAGLYKWLTPVFMLPFINLVLWFWPHKRHGV
jgi:hypothetical protein